MPSSSVRERDFGGAALPSSLRERLREAPAFSEPEEDELEDELESLSLPLPLPLLEDGIVWCLCLCTTAIWRPAKIAVVRDKSFLMTRGSALTTSSRYCHIMTMR